MNKHVLRYILDYIQERGCIGARLADIVSSDDVLECFGFAGLLDKADILVVKRELLELAAFERFRDEHQSGITEAFSHMVP